MDIKSNEGNELGSVRLQEDKECFEIQSLHLEPDERIITTRIDVSEDRKWPCLVVLMICTD